MATTERVTVTLAVELVDILVRESQRCIEPVAAPALLPLA